MELAHTGDNGLAGLLVGIRFKSGIFLCQFYKSHGHLFLTGLGLRLDGNINNRIREFHRFQYYRMILIAERISGCRIAQTYRRGDITGIHLINLLAVVGMHHQDTAKAFTLALGAVIHIGAGFPRTGIHTEERKFSYKGIGHNLKGKGRKRLIVRGMSILFHILFARNISLDCRNIYRRGHVIHDSIQQHLNSLIVV